MARTELPPVISILLNEPTPDNDFASIKRWYRRLSPEIRRQAAWTFGHFPYPKPRTSAAALVAVPSGGLDPCRSDAICLIPACRAKAVRQFARTLGLYADHVILADELSWKLLRRPRFSDQDIDGLAIDVSVLHELRPMIEAGLISFRSLEARYCEIHYKEFVCAIEEATGSILDDLKLPTSSKIVDDGIFLDVADLYGYPLNYLHRMSTASLQSNRNRFERITSDLFRRAAESLVQDAALILRDAADFNGTLFSSSRVSTLAVRQLEGVAPYKPGLDTWERSRSVELPWVRDLSISNIVRLREVAADALPRLRERLGTVMRGEEVTDNELNRRIEQLREEAAEVTAELKALRSRHESVFRNVVGLLGLTIAVYGFAADIVPAAPALASLMTLLGLLHSSEHKDYTDVQRLRSKPGYVLVKAQELLDHAHGVA